MLYKNCHYKYKDRICELIDFLPTTDGEDSNVKIRYTNGKESICLASELYEIPLTESILQSCYKSKTYVRDGNWDIIWHLGGNGSIIIGERTGVYFIIPSNTVATVVDLLPQGFTQCKQNMAIPAPIPLSTLSQIECLYPELKKTIRM